MKTFRVTFRDDDGNLQYGIYVIAPDIHTAGKMVPGTLTGIDYSGECIAIYSERDVTPIAEHRMSPIRKFLKEL